MHRATRLLAAGAALCLPVATGAQTPPANQTETPPAPASVPAAKPYVPPANLGAWASTIRVSVQGDAGITVNPDDPADRRNFGRLFDDDSNRPVLNQVLATIARDVDSKATSPDIGFSLQLLYGSDARVTHTLGVFDQLIHDRDQIDVLNANVAVRLPGVFAGGLDIKAGIYPTPLGYELIDPRTNPFYSHSYIFNYGLPIKHTGALATAHLSDRFDAYFGIDSGSQTAIGYGSGDNNNRPGGIAGIGYNGPGGTLTIVALTHMGPEDSRHNAAFANSAMRYYNDIVVTYKATDKLTLTAELDYVREDGFRAEGYGIAGYASYALSGQWTLNGRGEVFRDNSNFFVSTPAGNRDLVNSERGVAANLIASPKAGTYSELTAGVTYKPAGMPAALGTLLLRPEIRYDRTLNGVHSFGGGRNVDMVTLGADAVVGF